RDEWVGVLGDSGRIARRCASTVGTSADDDAVLVAVICNGHTGEGERGGVHSGIDATVAQVHPSIAVILLPLIALCAIGGHCQGRIVTVTIGQTSRLLGDGRVRAYREYPVSRGRIHRAVHRSGNHSTVLVVVHSCGHP